LSCLFDIELDVVKVVLYIASN